MAFALLRHHLQGRAIPVALAEGDVDQHVARWLPAPGAALLGAHQR
jgi:hypothetical protein